tara:strand:- start:2312 stop:3010 length:699 start_codon:yes stop_codon:yes gene_type:complete
MKKINLKNANWTFNKKIVKYFDEHIQSSIPLYNWTHVLGLKISDFFLPNNSKMIDLGCSTGTFIHALSDRHKDKKINFIGIDEQQSMIDFSKKKLKGKKNIKFFKQNINNANLKNSNFITSFYTIQFIHPSLRQKLFNKIYKSLDWGGGFLFFEKVRASDARFQDMFSQIYLEYKEDRNFTAKEIIDKSKSLKGVMEPFSSKANLELVKRAGFVDYITVYKFLCFEGFLAIK